MLVLFLFIILLEGVHEQTAHERSVQCAVDRAARYTAAVRATIKMVIQISGHCTNENSQRSVKYRSFHFFSVEKLNAAYSGQKLTNPVSRKTAATANIIRPNVPVTTCVK